MKKLDISNKLFHILMPILLGTVVGIIFKDYNSYIETLERTIKVPAIIFPIVWSILYVMIGFWYDFYEKQAVTRNKVLYYVLLFMNLAFTPVLFYLHQIVLALIIVVVLLIGNSYLFVSSLKMGKFSYLLIPYILWSMVALTLMFDLVINNVL